jgi:hypothetical protein
MLSGLGSSEAADGIFGIYRVLFVDCQKEPHMSRIQMKEPLLAQPIRRLRVPCAIRACSLCHSGHTGFFSTTVEKNPVCPEYSNTPCKVATLQFQLALSHIPKCSFLRSRL